MKDTEIHNGLDNQILRNYLSQSMVDSIVKGFDNVIAPVPYNENSLQWAKESAIAQIEQLQRTVKITEIKQAIMLLTQEQGWSEHDVSDYVQSSYSSRLHMTFVGTEAEHNDFMVSLGLEDF